MKVGFIGYSRCGKTTLFDAIAAGRKRGDLAAVPVTDHRFERLCDSVKPKKRTPATVEVLDNAANVPEGGDGGGFAEAARQMDLLLHVVREFDSPSVPFHSEPDPARDHASVETELLLADLQLAENRLSRLEKEPSAKSPGSSEYAERSVLAKVKPRLEEGLPLRKQELSDEEGDLLGGFHLLTMKPLIVVINCSLDRISADSECEMQMREDGQAVFRICAQIEKEIYQLEPADRKEFMRDLGIEQPASESVVRAVYEALGLITFFTATEKEARAWPLRKGSTALKAAGTVHTDMAKGFIRAEVVRYDDFERLGDIKSCYTQKIMKLEGKDYVVQDGDIIRIRHSG